MIDIVLPFNGWLRRPHSGAWGGISTAIPQSVPTGECLALRHFLSLTSVAALSGQHFS